MVVTYKLQCNTKVDITVGEFSALEIWLGLIYILYDWIETSILFDRLMIQVYEVVKSVSMYQIYHIQHSNSKLLGSCYKSYQLCWFSTIISHNEILNKSIGFSSNGQIGSNKEAFKKFTTVFVHCICTLEVLQPNIQELSLEDVLYKFQHHLFIVLLYFLFFHPEVTDYGTTYSSMVF